MKIVKVIETIAASEVGFEDAIQNCLNEVSKTIRNIDSIYVSEMKVHVSDNKITTYGVNCKVSFRVGEE
ncbi:MAG: dodecin family protein [Niabella sp.]